MPNLRWPNMINDTQPGWARVTTVDSSTTFTDVNNTRYGVYLPRKEHQTSTGLCTAGGDNQTDVSFNAGYLGIGLDVPCGSAASHMRIAMELLFRVYPLEVGWTHAPSPSLQLDS